MTRWHRTSLRRWLAPLLLVAFGWLFLPGPGFHEAQAEALRRGAALSRPAGGSRSPAAANMDAPGPFPPGLSQQAPLTQVAARTITQQAQSSGTKVLATFGAVRDSAGNITRVVGLNDYQVDYTMDTCHRSRGSARPAKDRAPPAPSVLSVP